MPGGRFAPSPTGPLHLGNLRTALAAWCFARSRGDAFTIRMDDLDQRVSSAENVELQLDALAALGIEWDGAVSFQTDHVERYDEAIDRLTTAGLTYDCYCTRREIQEAASAPHGGPMPDGAYPGTCRELSHATVSRLVREGRSPALRLRSQSSSGSVDDLLLGPITAGIDDLVLRRNDGVPAYNLAVVVDDAAESITMVVRGDDLATSAPRQRHLADLLGLPAVAYAHVGLVVSANGTRLAKRDGAVTLRAQVERGRTPDDVRAVLAGSLGFDAAVAAGPAHDLPSVFRREQVPAGPWTPDPEMLSSR